MDYAGALHIYGPEQWHDDAWIVGTEEALRALRDAIDAALENGAGACLSFTADGEGFAAVVLKVTPEVLDGLVLPYTDQIAVETRQPGLDHPHGLVTLEQYETLVRPPEEGQTP